MATIEENSRRTLSTHPQQCMKPLTFARSAILFAPTSESRGSASGRMLPSTLIPVIPVLPGVRAWTCGISYMIL